MLSPNPNLRTTHHCKPCQVEWAANPNRPSETKCWNCKQRGILGKYPPDKPDPQPMPQETHYSTDEPVRLTYLRRR